MNLLGCKNDGTVVDGETVGDDDPSLNMGSTLDMMASVETQYLDEMQPASEQQGSETPSSQEGSSIFDSLECNQSQVYKKEQVVWYKSSGSGTKATIIGVHFDGQLVPYYTILLANGREKQTDSSRLEPCAAMPEEYLTSALLREQELKKKLQLEQDRNKALESAFQKLDEAEKRNCALEKELKWLQKGAQSCDLPGSTSNATRCALVEQLCESQQSLVTMRTRRWMLLGASQVLWGSLIGLGWCHRLGMSPEMESIALFFATSAAATIKQHLDFTRETQLCQSQ